MPQFETLCRPADVIEAKAFVTVDLARRDFTALWDAVIVDTSIKIGYSGIRQFSFQRWRPKLSTAQRFALHASSSRRTSRNGQDTLARGLASRAAEAMSRKISLLEVEPHALQALPWAEVNRLLSISEVCYCRACRGWSLIVGLVK